MQQKKWIPSCEPVAGQVYDPWVTTHRAGMTKEKISGSERPS
ncbi:MAG: hypothetical protein Q8J64_01205 [Thermodesulfovibrionales bacterium]|nr:hypothetical protein [Thermodesulfovibrionales bacterium]